MPCENIRVLTAGFVNTLNGKKGYVKEHNIEIDSITDVYGKAKLKTSFYS